MKIKLPLFIILIAILFGCSTNKSHKSYSEYSKEELEIKKENIEVDINREVALAYLKYLEYNSSAYPLEHNHSKGYYTYTKEELETKKENIEIDVNHDIAVAYLKYSEDNNTVPPLGYYSWEKVKKYKENNPMLMKYREEYNASSKKFKDFINQDKRKGIAYEKYRRKEISREEYIKVNSIVYRDMELKHPEEYKELRTDSRNKLGISNRKTLEVIISDYHSNNKLFPINWIPENELSLIKNNRYIKRRLSEIDKIEDELIRRI